MAGLTSRNAWARLQAALSGLERWQEYADANKPNVRRQRHERIHGRKGQPGSYMVAPREPPPWRHVPSHGSHHRFQPTDIEPDPTVESEDGDPTTRAPGGAPTLAAPIGAFRR